MSASNLLLLLLFSCSSGVMAYEYCGVYCVMASVFGLFGTLFCMCGLFCFIGILTMLIYYLVDLSRKKKESAPTVHYHTQSLPQVYKPQPPQTPSIQIQPPTQILPAPAPSLAQSRPPSYHIETERPISHVLNDSSQAVEHATPLIMP